MSTDSTAINTIFKLSDLCHRKHCQRKHQDIQDELLIPLLKSSDTLNSEETGLALYVNVSLPCEVKFPNFKMLILLNTLDKYVSWMHDKIYTNEASP